MYNFHIVLHLFGLMPIKHDNYCRVLSSIHTAHFFGISLLTQIHVNILNQLIFDIRGLVSWKSDAQPKVDIFLKVLHYIRLTNVSFTQLHPLFPPLPLLTHLLTSCFRI